MITYSLQESPQLKLAYRKGVITLTQYAEIKQLPQFGQGGY